MSNKNFLIDFHHPFCPGNQKRWVGTLNRRKILIGGLITLWLLNLQKDYNDYLIQRRCWIWCHYRLSWHLLRVGDHTDDILMMVACQFFHEGPCRHNGFRYIHHKNHRGAWWVIRTLVLSGISLIILSNEPSMISSMNKGIPKNVHSQ